MQIPSFLGVHYMSSLSYVSSGLRWTRYGRHNYMNRVQLCVTTTMCIAHSSTQHACTHTCTHINYCTPVLKLSGFYLDFGQSASLELQLCVS